jgi:hypothetical protein
MAKAPKVLTLWGLFLCLRDGLSLLRFRVSQLKNRHLTRKVLHWYNGAERTPKTKAPKGDTLQGLLNH